MKKGLLVFVTILFTVTILTACGSSKPKNMTQTTYDIGCKALELMDKYNSADITAEEAEIRLKSLMNDLDDEQFTEEELLESSNNTLVNTNIFLFISALSQNGITSTYSEADDLRELLGK